jgi:hypothetical protein
VSIAGDASNPCLTDRLPALNISEEIGNVLTTEFEESKIEDIMTQNILLRIIPFFTK